ncbi:MAG TPA: hypothetical protein VFR94_02975 [Nitrososphaeraceae archaeon]|nr:hypothetical protein [Nitrososphaeraceae archaeon]
MVPSVRTTSRRHDDAACVLRQDDEDDESRNAGDVHGFSLIEWRLALIIVIFYHMFNFYL